MAHPFCQLVLLPGLHGRAALFEPFLHHLPPDIRPVTVEFPIEATLDYDALFSLVFRQIPVDGPFVLLGESFAGPLALRVAAARPPNLRGVILAQSFVHNPMSPWPGWVGRMLGWLGFRLVPHWLRARLVMSWDGTPQLRHILDRELDRVGPQVLEARFRAALQVDERRALRDCPVPILSLQGNHDRIVWKSNLRQIQRLRPDVQAVTLAGPHLLMQTHPIEAAEVIAAFARRACVGETWPIHVLANRAIS